MKAKEMFEKVVTFADKNAPAILTGMTIVGVVTTAITAARAGIKIHEIMQEYKKEKEEIENSKYEDAVKADDIRSLQLDCTKQIILAGLPPVLSAVGTSFAAIKSNTESSNRIKAVGALYALSQNNLSISEEKLKTLEDKATEIIGEKKVANLKNAVIEERGNKIDIPSSENMMVTGMGSVPCIDLWDKNVIFYSTQGEVESAINKLSQMANDEGFASVGDLYELLGIKEIPTFKYNIGWTSECCILKNLPISVTTFLHKSGVPCLAIDYEIEPFANPQKGGTFRNR